jgi:hypothetical protein
MFTQAKSGQLRAEHIYGGACWPFGGSKGGVPMAPLSTNPDRNFSAGYGEAKREIDQLMAEPSLPLDIDDPAIRERIGKLIVDAMRRWASS